jgi:hypothetical protein
VLFAEVGEPCLVRVLNAGLWTHSMHLHANHFFLTCFNGKVQSNLLWLDTFTSRPMDTYDMVVPFTRPPDIANTRGIGWPDPGLITRTGQPAWPPIQEFNVFQPKQGTEKRSFLDPNIKVDIAERQSPLVYPMHDHSEASQTAQGGNYNCGLIAGMTIIGDRNTPGWMNFPREEDFIETLALGDGAPITKPASGDPHAYTVPYDYEALWVVDDVDLFWHNVVGQEAKAFYPAILDRPGVDDLFFHGHFHDFNPDYWYITGVSVPGIQGTAGTIPAGITVPRALNSGVAGMQVSINAQVNQTILVRCLDAAYNSVDITFPVDVVIIAYDGRALGVPPFARYNYPFLVPAGTPLYLSTSRRFDALIRSATPVNAFATVRFFNTRGENVPGRSQLLKTAQIPISIT